MPANGIHIFGLNRKIMAMAETLCEAGQIESSTYVALAKECDINVSTLKSACAKQQVTNRVIQKLSTGCNFDINHPSWIDKEVDPTERRLRGSNHSGFDRPENFKRYLREVWGLSTTYSISIESSPPTVHDSLLATFSIDSGRQSIDSDSIVPLFLTIDAETQIHEEGFAYGFNVLRVTLDLPNTQNHMSINRYDLSEESSLTDAKFIKRGTDFNPFWLLESTQGALEGNYMTTDTPLCDISQLSVGSTIKATLSAQLRDGSLTRIDGQEMPSAAKRAIIESLLVKTLDSNAQKRGRLTLSNQLLKAVRTN